MFPRDLLVVIAVNGRKEMREAHLDNYYWKLKGDRLVCLFYD